ncbi:MAG TPA: biotin--[acetyl-CoA-carboxylase] ligase [Intrasporangiaceae bacterium]|nr:biotin--[acetyl-CoA-carboxylase] ligase [Intrasporangiaceae bacterium]
MRTPLQVRQLTAHCAPPWRDIRLVAETGSTNTDVAVDANRGAARAWEVLVAEHQNAGRGRLDRDWTTTPGTALTFSALVPTPAEPGWVPLIAGLSVAEAVAELYAVRPALKWPNDILAPVGSALEGAKVAGVLCELTGAGIVVGVGLNVDQEDGELPVPTATSLRLLAQGHPPGLTRERLLLTILDHLANRLAMWSQDPDQVRDAYRSGCVTIGQDVRVDLGQDRVQVARAVGVDDTGRLVIESGAGRRPVAAGDVTHVRQDSP